MVDKKLEKEVKGCGGGERVSRIVLRRYEGNGLKYEVKCGKGGRVVFGEI